MRLLLLIVVLLIGYDAIVYQGAYTRSIWTSVVGLTSSAVGDARDAGRSL